MAAFYANHAGTVRKGEGIQPPQPNRAERLAIIASHQRGTSSSACAAEIPDDGGDEIPRDSNWESPSAGLGAGKRLREAERHGHLPIESESAEKRAKETAAEDELVACEGHLFEHFNSVTARKLCLLSAANVDLTSHKRFGEMASITGNKKFQEVSDLLQKPQAKPLLWRDYWKIIKGCKDRAKWVTQAKRMGTPEPDMDAAQEIEDYGRLCFLRYLTN